VVASLDACTTLYFDHLPPPWNTRLRIVHYATWGAGLPEEMVGASAVVFVRALFHFAHWIEFARQLGIPHYYFLDDNLLLLAHEYSEYAGYTEENVREMLRSFAGVLVPTPALAADFADRGLHPRLIHYPPSVRRPPGRGPAPPVVESGRVRVGYFGGPHRNAAFRAFVVPAVRKAGEDLPLELVAMGIDEGSVDAGPHVPVTYVPYERSHDLALRTLAAHDVHILAHPNSASANNPFKTLHVLANAAALGAAPVLSEGPPYDRLRGSEAALLCPDEIGPWAEAIGRLARDLPLRERIASQTRLYCAEHYSGRANVDVVRTILEQHPSSGSLLRDVRYRKALRLVKRSFAPSHVAPREVPRLRVPIGSWMRYTVRPPKADLSQLTIVIGVMNGPVSGSMELQLVDPATRAVLRRSSVPIRDVMDRVEASFRFDPLPDADGRTLIARFVPRADGRLALFEDSDDAKKLKRRLLRKVGLDHWGRDLHCTLR
jgi:hypothetical protein